MRVAAQEVLGGDAAIGEIAPAPTGDADLLGKSGGVVEQQHAASALPGGGGAHHACRTGADDYEVEALLCHNGARCIESGAEYARRRPAANLKASGGECPDQKCVV